MAIPLIIWIGAALITAACDDKQNVGRDLDEQDGAQPPPLPKPTSACEFPAQARVSLDGSKALLACAKNWGSNFEVFNGREVEEYTVPAMPPPLFGHPRVATDVQNFAIDGIDEAVFVVTRYTLGEELAGTVHNVLSVFQEGEDEPRAQMVLHATDDEDLKLTAMQAMKNRFTGEIYVNVIFQASNGIDILRYRFHGFEAETILQESNSVATPNFLEEEKIAAALPPTRLDDLESVNRYGDPFIVVKESGLQVYELSQLGINFVDFFPENFHPTPAPVFNDENLLFPPSDIAFEYAGSTYPASIAVPGLEGKILFYSVLEAGDSFSVGGGDIPGNWQTVISLPVEEDVLHVTHTAQKFDAEETLLNDVEYFALTADGSIFSVPPSNDVAPQRITQLDNFDRTKARGFFILQDHLVTVLAGEEQNQYYSVPRLH